MIGCFGCESEAPVSYYGFRQKSNDTPAISLQQTLSGLSRYN